MAEESRTKYKHGRSNAAKRVDATRWLQLSQQNRETVRKSEEEINTKKEWLAIGRKFVDIEEEVHETKSSFTANEVAQKSGLCEVNFVRVGWTITSTRIKHSYGLQTVWPGQNRTVQTEPTCQDHRFGTKNNKLKSQQSPVRSLLLG
ncbi:uncharacterized protein LOC119768923 [Culex quinquefasciatus]|uniref:uncharacterized protein LOC119768923 n=1 Tax=Culex quinquefasciatus TaxID=7176 RepID=UPI0018E36C26|nr:uncharacterized protein LOC119768923 [Culex quinquefasciatus]